jgi:hypothetical protein
MMQIETSTEMARLNAFTRAFEVFDAAGTGSAGPEPPSLARASMLFYAMLRVASEEPARVPKAHSLTELYVVRSFSNSFILVK